MGHPPAAESPAPRRRPRGEGSIKWDERRQRYRGRVELGYEGGRRLRKEVWGTSLRQVQTRIAEVLADVRRGARIRSDTLTLGAWLDTWLEEYIRPRYDTSGARTGGREPTTFDGYTALVEHHIRPYLGRKGLTRLQLDDVEGWQRALERNQVGARTRAAALTRLHTALNVAIRRGRATWNPVALAERPRQVPTKRPPPDPNRAQTLLEKMKNPRDRAVVIMTLGLGLRRGEALGLKWEDVDVGRNLVHVHRRVSRTKSAGLIVREGLKMHQTERLLPLPGLLRSALEDHWRLQLQDRLTAGTRWVGADYTDGRHGPILTSEIGTIMEPRQVNRALKQACADAELPHLSPHQLRHDYAGLLLQRGVPLAVVSVLLGHRDQVVTARIYAHLVPQMHPEAARELDAALGFEPLAVGE